MIPNLADKLSDYEVYNHVYWKKEQAGIVTLIHWDHDVFSNIHEWVESLVEEKKVDDLYVNYHRLYSFCHYPTLFTTQIPNFNYVYRPELLFLQAQKNINFNELPNLRKDSFKKTFCFLNNRPTNSRKELFDFFKHNQLLDMSYASYNNNSQRNTREDKIEQPYKNFIEYPVHIDITPDIGNFYPVKDFLFDVCAETYCLEDHIGLTEKSIKPFLWGHIPLIFGPAGTYRYLKSLGFDVFDNIIDTNFDNERHHKRRMWRFQQEVLRLSKIPLTSYDKLQLELRFLNNRNVYLKNVQRSLQTLDWIERETNFLVNNRIEYIGF